MALKHFPGINNEEALARPILYSNWMTKNYVPVDREELRDYVKVIISVCDQILYKFYQKRKTFFEETIY